MDTRTRHEGVAAVEFGLLVMVLVVMTFGMTEIGRAFYYYNGLVTSTRMAARYLSTRAPGEGEAQARCLAVYGDATCAGTPLVPRLDPAMVHFTYQPAVATGAGENTIDLVRVTVQDYPFISFMPTIVSDVTFGDIACTMRQEAS
jgi:Flp pilus assembly protein TadG